MKKIFDEILISRMSKLFNLDLGSYYMIYRSSILIFKRFFLNKLRL